MEPLAVVAALFFGACLVGAAVGDVKRLTIPNTLTLGLALGAPAWHLGAATGALLPALAGGGALLFAGFALFVAGWIGGGDVKLAAATMLWLAPAEQAAFLIGTALAGGLLAAALLALYRIATATGAAHEAPAALGPKPAMPYGLAIAAGGLAAFPWSQV